ncbi:hypothetical protein CFN78_06655 [Amycolatopsis antarctica]|uniref:Uncharacterized protein n=1 Tax=Amycolatopsis antarctica TaxID=1854586 RepID=A0A263D621_9PSEU|nr:hypothetical protein [Amycolatopsis antarctica]OZM73962.1 hypothetical protein CFN78_06655 [Amycolatopsis antarctica]
MTAAPALDVLYRECTDDGLLHAYPASDVRDHTCFYLHPIGHIEAHRRPHVIATTTSSRMCPTCALALGDHP